jgi:hypothetical protein
MCFSCVQTNNSSIIKKCIDTMGLNRDEARAVDLGAWEEKRVSEIVDNKEDCGGEGGMEE